MKMIALGLLMLLTLGAGCGGEAPLETSSALSAAGVWQMGYNGGGGCVGEMDIETAGDDGDWKLGGIYWCLTESGYVHGDIVGRQVGQRLTTVLHRADVEATASGTELVGTATVGDQSFVFHAHR